MTAVTPTTWLDTHRTAASLPEQPTRRCSRCRTRLPATAEFFDRHRSQPGGLSYWCKPCKGRAQKRRYKARAARDRARAAARYAAIRALVAAYPDTYAALYESHRPGRYEHRESSAARVRAVQRGRNAAHRDLIAAHRDEYDALYHAALTARGLEPRTSADPKGPQ